MPTEIQSNINVDLGNSTQTIGELKTQFDQLANSQGAAITNQEKLTEQFNFTNDAVNISTARLKQLQAQAAATNETLTTGMQGAAAATIQMSAATEELGTIQATTNAGLLDSLAKQRVAFMDVGRVIDGQGFSLRSLTQNFTLFSPAVVIGAVAIGALAAGLYEAYEKEISLTDTQEHLRDSLAGAADDIAKVVTGVEQMNDTFDEADKGMISRKEALDDYNANYGKTLGIATSLNQAEQLFADKTAAYIQAETLRAEARAAAALQQAAIEAQIKGDTEGNLSLLDKGKIFLESYFNGISSIATNITGVLQKNHTDAQTLIDDYAKITKSLTDQADAVDKANNINTRTPPKTKTNHDNSLKELQTYIEASQKIREDAEEKEITDEDIKYQKIYNDLVANHHSTETLTIQHEQNLVDIRQKFADQRQAAITAAFAKFNSQVEKAQQDGVESLLKAEDSYFSKSDDIGVSAEQKKIDNENNTYNKLLSQAMLYGLSIEKLEQQHETNLATIKQDAVDAQLKKDKENEAKSLNQEISADRSIVSDKTISYSAKKALLNQESADVEKAYNDQAISYEQYVKFKSDIAKTETAIDKERMKEQIDFANNTADLLTQISTAVGTSTQAGKDFAIAAATIKAFATIANIIEGFSELGPWGIAAGVAAAAAAAVGLFNNIKQIEDVSVPGQGSSSASSSSASSIGAGAYIAPNIPQSQIQTNLSAQSIQQINQANAQPQRVYVLESDITNAQVNVQTNRNAASIGGGN